MISPVSASTMLRATTRPIRNAADLASSNQDAKELFYFDMVAAGIWIALRGFVALNLMIGDVPSLVSACTRQPEAIMDRDMRRAIACLFFLGSLDISFI